MIHHVSLGTDDLGTAKAFYDAVLDVIGLRLTYQDDRSIGYGTGETVFSLETPVDGKSAAPGNGVHVAFVAGSREMVDAFHRAALAHGGRDDGPPGLRPRYDAHYYAAFVRDPDGNKIEAVAFVSK